MIMQMIDHLVKIITSSIVVTHSNITPTRNYNVNDVTDEWLVTSAQQIAQSKFIIAVMGYRWVYT